LSIESVLDGSDKWYIQHDHVLDGLKKIPDGSVQMVVTSPPYWGLRSYGTYPQDWSDGWTGELGSEPTSEMYVDHIVEIFKEVFRVLSDDATVWLNIGDGYAGSGRGPSGNIKRRQWDGTADTKPAPRQRESYKPKDLLGIPYRIVMKLQEAGYYWRSEIIWSKPNCMPESVADRPTASWEPIFLLSKSAKYKYNDVPEPAITGGKTTGGSERDASSDFGGVRNGLSRVRVNPDMRRMRNVWEIPTEGYQTETGGHIAVFPTELARRCILAGSDEANVVMDIFSGSGTTGVVALRQNRRYIGLELNLDYVNVSKYRIKNDAPLFN
jgi:DNA modification methylase